jgi:hypothetical protein
MKTYVLTISNTFPKNHKKSGLPTNFIQKINSLSKLHTIRGNFLLWQKRFEKIEKGEACLSIRNWTGKPYNSKQVEVFNLKNTDGISLEKLEFYEDKNGVANLKYPLINNKFEPNIDIIAENDGLSLSDFKEWFKGYDLSQPMAIIHFTHFKYSH